MNVRIILLAFMLGFADVGALCKTHLLAQPLPTERHPNKKQLGDWLTAGHAGPDCWSVRGNQFLACCLKHPGCIRVGKG